MERKIQMEFLTNDLILRTVTNSDIEEIVKMWAYPEVITVENAYNALEYMERTHNQNRPKEICHLVLGVFRKEVSRVAVMVDKGLHVPVSRPLHSVL